MNKCDIASCALEALNDAGIVLHKIGIFKRVWSGERLGEGEFVDSVEYISPTPRLEGIDQTYSNDKGGMQRKADLIIKLLPKPKYPLKTDIDCTSKKDNEELYYFINEEIYEVVEVHEKQFYWNIIVRKAKKRRFNFSS
jgi:hypothetical protein